MPFQYIREFGVPKAEILKVAAGRNLQKYTHHKADMDVGPGNIVAFASTI